MTLLMMNRCDKGLTQNITLPTTFGGHYFSKTPYAVSVFSFCVNLMI